MGLTEAQIAAMRPHYTEYPERIISAPGYPANRRKRGLKPDEQAALATTEPGALPAGGLSGAPSTKLWSVYLYSATADTYWQRGSPPFDGPGLIHSFVGFADIQQPFGTVDPIQINYAASPIGDVSGTTNLTLPGTPIGLSSPVVFQNSAVPLSRPTGLALDEGFAGGQGVHPLGVYVPLERFYLGVSIFARNNVSNILTGYFRVIENAPPEAVGW